LCDFDMIVGWNGNEVSLIRIYSSPSVINGEILTTSSCFGSNSLTPSKPTRGSYLNYGLLTLSTRTEPELTEIITPLPKIRLFQLVIDKSSVVMNPYGA
jgi:hypothetical protein